MSKNNIHSVIPERHLISKHLLSPPSCQLMNIPEVDFQEPAQCFYQIQSPPKGSSPDTTSSEFQNKTNEADEESRTTSPPTKTNSSNVRNHKEKKVLRKIENRFSNCGKTRVRAWKKYSKKKHLTQDEMDKKRDIANQQERTRMHRLNSALRNLRNAIPYEFSRHPPEKNLSKIKTLRIAIDYIRQLTSVLSDIPEKTP